MTQIGVPPSRVGEPGDQWREYRRASIRTDDECEGRRAEAGLRLLDDDLDPEALVVLDASGDVQLPDGFGVHPVATVPPGGDVVRG